MPTLLIRNADEFVTMDSARREIASGGLFARDGIIDAVGRTGTHHHMFQNLTRAGPCRCRLPRGLGYGVLP